MDLGVLRLVVALVVVGLLGRAARPAWRHRELAVLVWRAIRPRHVLGAIGLLTLVVATMGTLLTLIPVSGWGLGHLVGLSGNAVFAPLEEAVSRSGGVGATDPATSSALDPLVTLGMIGFLVLLLGLFPWLAYVEERAFRSGLEDASLGRRAWRALQFGLIHLVMLIPIAAAIAIGVAGFAYGQLYRASYRRTLRRFQQTDSGLFGLLQTNTAVTTGAARSVAVLASTVWHTTFNSLIVVLLIVGLLVDAALG